MKVMLHKVFDKSKQLLFTRINEILLLISVLFGMRVLQVCFNIKDLNYLVILMLFIGGVCLFKVCEWASKRYSFAVTLSWVYLIVLSAVSLTKQKNLFYIFNLYADSFYRIDNALRHSKDTLFIHYLPYIAIAVPFLTAINLYTLKKNKVYLSIMSMLSLMIYLWYTRYGHNRDLYYFICLFLCCAFYGVNICSKSGDYFKNAGYAVLIKREGVISYVIMISAVITCMGYLFINNLGTKDFSEAFNQFKLENGIFQSIVINNSYSLASTGYGDNGKLGGPVQSDNALAFRVESDGLYYLRGTVRDYYDGFSWKRSSDEYVDISKRPVKRYSRDLMRYLLLYSRQQYSMSRRMGLGIDNKKIVVYPENINTSTIFTPNNSYDIAIDGGIPGSDNARSFMLLNRLSSGKPYSVFFTWTRAGIENFLNFREFGLEMSYSVGASQTSRQKEYYDYYIKERYAKYLQLPENISPEVYRLVDEITKGSRTTSEKVWRINQYLQQNYKYSTNVSQIPGGQEFVDYFLFTEKEGYCAYFATASTILFRVAGIPARYVEGFSMGDIKDNGGLYVVTNNMAHAWAEVLILPEEDLWALVDSTPPRPLATPEETLEALPLQNAETNTDPVESTEVNEPTAEDTLGEGLGLTLTWSATEITAALLSLALLLYIILRLVMYRSIKSTALNSKSIIPVYYYAKKRLKAAGKDSAVYDNDMIWLDSIDDSELKYSLSELVNKTYEEFFGKREVKDFNKLNIYFIIEKYVRKNQNFFIYYLKKYFI